MLIFGYEARIFNDKDVAIKVERGHYLIPWQSSDTRYMMDRYDVRHMMEDLEKELSQYDSKQQHINKDEDLCNQERYEDLDSEEEMLFDMSEDERDEHVEEKKREREKKEQEAAFHVFDYDGKIKEEKDRSAIQQEIASEYKAPDDMVVPTTREQASIISDTAQSASASVNPSLFEIKTHARQANNPLYAFLSKRHELYPFYKHLSWLLSSGLGAYGDSSSESEDDDASDSNNKKDDSKDDNDVSHDNQQDQESEAINEPKLEEHRVIIDKTARFVARAGPQLEQKIRQRHARDPKFAFLYQNNEYHNYYQTKIKYFQILLLSFIYNKVSPKKVYG
ncbi:alternative splicing regulator-domain-containing protein [Circinella umbellata]|nr:alternative splicing regulator-domain-containing protein [Circinella umbellata]